MAASQKSNTASHPEFFVDFVPGAFNSGLRTKKAFAADDVLAKLEGLTKALQAYSSVQCGRGPDDHIELNSELVYVNHSCEPNVAFDLSSNDRSFWHVRALKAINSGDSLTFFYPSTEWEMVQPFECHCGAATCLGIIKGAACLSAEELNKRGFINKWILELATERDGLTQNGINGNHLTKRNSAEANGECLNCGYGYPLGGDTDRCGCHPN